MRVKEPFQGKYLGRYTHVFFQELAEERHEIIRLGNFLHDPRTQHEYDTKKQGLSLVLLGSGHNWVNTIMTRL